jgi:eukaryotic-like serine/threonine-protein kinase
VLPAASAGDAQRRERLQREAGTISKLTHPNICTLFDIGEQEGTTFLVMELLEGETLAVRLEKGALPLDAALKIATQIADALDVAHRHGIVHRDLKPGNLMLTKTGAKLFDFGLAKASAPAMAGAGPSMLPPSPKLTAQGTILGTFQYMAPEQVEGEEADARTDIFAFGVLLYEMLTGSKAFHGKSQASLFGAILKDEPPPISTVQPLTPHALDRVVKKCLAKDPDRRWQRASDVHDELQWIAEAVQRPATSGAALFTNRANHLAWVVGAMGIMAAIAVGASAFVLRRPTVDSGAYRTSILAPDNASFGSSVPGAGAPQGLFALSPDGRRLVFVAKSDDGHMTCLQTGSGFWSIPRSQDRRRRHPSHSSRTGQRC